MKMEDRLAGISVRVHHRPISCFGNAFFSRDLGRSQREPSYQRGILCLVQRGHMLTRNDEDVYRRFRINISKSDAVVGLVDQFRRNLSTNDFTKQAVGSHSLSLVALECGAHHRNGRYGSGLEA